MDVRVAVGFPVIDPAARTMPETVIDDVKTFVFGSELYGREEALAFVRVSRVGRGSGHGSGTGDVRRQRRADGRRRREPSYKWRRPTRLAIVAWTQVQSVMHHLLAEHPFRNVGFAEALMRGELHVALAFVDLVSSTAWAESVDLAVHAEALRRFEMQSSTLAADHGARLVKLIGDEAMVVSDDPAALCAPQSKSAGWQARTPTYPRPAALSATEW